MADLLFFPHAHGLTEGLAGLAERLRAAGHAVYTPDLYGGRVFGHLDEGMAFAASIGHDAIEEAASRALRQHPRADTVVGFSLGAFPAQLLAQESRRIRSCALVAGALSPAELRGEWRHDVRLALHVADPDDWVNPHGVKSLFAHAPAAELFTYRGRRHLFMDPSLADYDADAADTFEERLLAWLDAGTSTPRSPQAHGPTRRVPAPLKSPTTP